MAYENIREEELKNQIAEAYFYDFDCKKIIGNIDFCVSSPAPLFAPLFVSAQTTETQSLLWAEAKKGQADIEKSIVQLILTVGKARTFDKTLPPAFLGAFDSEKIAFIPYNEIQEIFYLNDFNWNVTPSNYETKEFGIVLEKVRETIAENSLLFFFGKDDQEIHSFIKNNFILGKSGTSKIQIDKNNFITIYTKWLQTVKPTIAVNWEIAKKNGIIDADFYLADLLSSENETLKEKLYVLLKKDYYELDRKLDEMGMFDSKKTAFKDKQKAHQQFWNKYQRPPREEYWDYIVERRDLLVPQDVRERKGSFFTPQIWVELSQHYLAEVLGENWQDEYYIWDCAAGTGNLLAGLTNKRHIWASTLDRQDVDVMKDRIANGANLLESHVFQFDFLNDSFEKLPTSLQNVINDPEKRRKLVIYINPPYADSSSNKHDRGKARNSFTQIHEKYQPILSNFGRELFAQFLIRIYMEIPDCKIAEFSKIKLLSVSHAKMMRTHFLAKLEKIFLVPARTFDNVTGHFPIGFKIWDTAKKEKFVSVSADVFDGGALFSGHKNIYSFDDDKKINKWLKEVKDSANGLAYLSLGRNDFQNKNFIFIINSKELATNYFYPINRDNLLKVCIYFSTQKVMVANWLNDRDQFLYPSKKWEKDAKFQNDCLAYALFTNNISSKYGTNHWIPFTEDEVDAHDNFESNFMTKFIQGKLKQEGNGTLLETEKQRNTPLEFSTEAQAVFEAGRELWKYYHAKINEPTMWGFMEKANINASLYDIREYFQGRNENGKMNHSSQDEKYKELIGVLREKIDILAKKIQPKVYEYGFLRA